MSQTHAGPDGRVWQGRGRAALGFDALAADVGAGPDAGACLLPDLAGQGLLQGLAGLDGAAGKRPVGGVPGDQDDLGLGREADAKRLGRLGRRRQEGWVEPPDAVAGPIRDDGLLDKGLEGRGGSGVWRRVGHLEERVAERVRLHGTYDLDRLLLGEAAVAQDPEVGVEHLQVIGGHDRPADQQGRRVRVAVDQRAQRVGERGQGVAPIRGAGRWDLQFLPHDGDDPVQQGVFAVDVAVQRHALDAQLGAELVRQIGAVLEGSRNVYWSMSAWQNLLYFGRLKGLRGGELKPRAERLLGELGLWDRRGEPVGTFSRGMQQKVAVAAALITDPPIVLLDEPTIGLDVEAARTVKDWVVRLAHEQHKTVVLTTHQLAMAEELSDRVAVIRDGAIVADLPTADLLGRFREDRYEVRVAGPPDQLGPACLPGDVSVAAEDGATRITLPTADADDLFKLLAEVQSLGLPLLSVRQVEPDLEEVFLRLVHAGRAA